MPLDFRKFRKLLKDKGYDVVVTSWGHYYVVKPDGTKLAHFAVGHGHNKGLVLDFYVSRVLKAIDEDA